MGDAVGSVDEERLITVTAGKELFSKYPKKLQTGERDSYLSAMPKTVLYCRWYTGDRQPCQCFYADVCRLQFPKDAVNGKVL